MRMFNPEKELNKIQKGNKNKIILGVISLLLIVAIGSSYALYQIKYNKQIIYTTVEPFYSKDMQLAVYVDNKKQEDFPSKEEGYLYEGIECENEEISANFNSKTWELELKLDKPNRCNVKFTSNPFKAAICKDTEISECLLKKELKYNKELAYDDSDQNGRYIGANPNNYIWFNCDDYSNPTEETCERWRIIGSFKNMEKVVSDSEDGETTYEKQNLVKIIRANSIGNMAWDITGGEYGSNDWTGADLQESLNGIYYNGENLGDGKGITATTKDMIENIKWNLGRLGSYRTLASRYYELERGTSTYNSQPTIWNGYIGLMYPSDYGYATSGLVSSNTTDREGCLAVSLGEGVEENWMIGEYKTNCAKNSWLLDSVNHQWTLMSYNNSPSVVFTVANFGTTANDVACSTLSVRPTLYITHDTKITSGDGSYDNPYVLA